MLVFQVLAAFVVIAALAWVTIRARSRIRIALAAVALLAAAAAFGWLAWAGEKTDGADPVGLLAVLLAAAATAAALRYVWTGRYRRALAFLLTAAFLLRANGAARLWLSPWDERYHALVARNVMDHPWKPTLVEHPVEDEPLKDGFHGHLWLHKPPLTIWMMAASMGVFGQNEIALRVPSLIFGTLGVLVTFLLAGRFVGRRGGALAAAFHAWHGYGTELSSGLRPTDHVDAIFVFFVGLAALAAVWAGDAFLEGKPRAWRKTLLAGGVLGLALLTKSMPAMVLVGFFFVHLCLRRARPGVCLGAPVVFAAVAVLVTLPWEVFTAFAYPAAYAYKSAIFAKYFFEVVHAHSHEWYWHLENLLEHFGGMAWLPLGAFFAWGAWRRREWLALLAWFAGTYTVFSLAATKLPAYPQIASPVFWCAFGWFADLLLFEWNRAPLLFRWPGSRVRWIRLGVRLAAAGVVVWVGFEFVSLGRYNLKPALPRRPRWAEELRYLAGETRKLPPGKWVAYNVFAPMEAMFYADVTCERVELSRPRYEKARAKGFRVAVYGTPKDVPPELLARKPAVTFIPPDPRTRALRRVVRELQARGIERAALYVGRHAQDVQEYVDRFLPARAVTGMPARNRWLRRRLRDGMTMVVLVGPATPGVEAARREFTEAVFLQAGPYAN